MIINHECDYAERRRKAYPPLVDQVEAILKGGAELAQMRATIDAVKARYPKPTRRP